MGRLLSGSFDPSPIVMGLADRDGNGMAWWMATVGFGRTCLRSGHQRCYSHSFYGCVSFARGSLRTSMSGAPPSVLSGTTIRRT